MTMPRLIRAAALLAALLCLLPPAVAHPAAPRVQIASSSMLVLDATVHAHDIVLRVARTADHTPIEGAGNVTAQIGGRPVPLVAHGDTYVLSTHGLKSGAQSLQVVVAHDGIHELLSGTVTLPKHPDRLAVLERHGYGAWWVLNIVVLLLAARLIMRRKKPAAKAS